MADYSTLTVSPGVLFNFAAILVTIPVIVSAYRQPLKKRYHYFFMALMAAVGLGYFSIFATTHFSSSPDVFLSRSHIARFYLYDLLPPLLIGFVAYFLRPKLDLLHKGLLLGSLAVYLAYMGIYLTDPNFIAGPPVRATPTGYSSSPGNLAQYFVPGGIDAWGLITTVIVLADLVWFYRSHRSSFPKGQFGFLSVGICVMLFDFDVGPSLLNKVFKITGFNSILWICAITVLIIGIRRHGFYGVAPVAETALVTPTLLKYPLQEGRTYLSRSYQTSFEAFSELVMSGRSGLCISRTMPDDVRKTYGLKTTPVRWLAEERREDAIPPTDLLGLSITIKDFVNKAQRPVVVLEGLEYLIRLNGFYSVLRLVDGLNEASGQKNGILLISVLPNALPPREDALLAANTSPLPGPEAPEISR